MIYELTLILKSCQKNNWWMVTKPRFIQVQHLLLWLRLLRVPQLCNCMCRLLPITQVPTSRRFTQAPASKRLSQRFLYLCWISFLFNKLCYEIHYQSSVKHYVLFFSHRFQLCIGFIFYIFSVSGSFPKNVPFHSIHIFCGFCFNLFQSCNFSLHSF